MPSSEENASPLAKTLSGSLGPRRFPRKACVEVLARELPAHREAVVWRGETLLLDPRRRWEYSGFMARKRNVHTVPYGDKWAVKEEGSSSPRKTFDTKEQAEEFGRELAKKKGVEHFIHGKDGKIQDRESYGKDPYPPKDRKH